MENTLSETELATLIQTLLELGKEEPSGNFDQTSMSRLFAMRLVEVRAEDRRLILTDAGRRIFDRLNAPPANGN